MMILLVVLLAAGVALYFMGRDNAALKMASLAVFAVAIVVGVIRVVQVLRAGSGLELDSIEEVAGYRLGEAVAAACPEGELLVLRLPPLKAFRNETTQYRMNGFKKAVGNRYTILEGGPDEPVATCDNPDFLFFKAEEFGKAVDAWKAAHPKAVGVVSLLPSIPGDIGKSGDPLPWFAFVTEAARNWRRDVASGRLKVAISMKAVDNTIAFSNPRNDEERFDLLYRLVTAKDTDELQPR